MSYTVKSLIDRLMFKFNKNLKRGTNRLHGR